MGDQTDLYELAEEAGYKVIKTKAEAENLTAEDGKAIVIDETLADDDAMSYDMDLEDGGAGFIYRREWINLSNTKLNQVQGSTQSLKVNPFPPIDETSTSIFQIHVIAHCIAICKCLINYDCLSIFCGQSLLPLPES